MAIDGISGREILASSLFCHKAKLKLTNFWMDFIFMYLFTAVKNHLFSGNSIAVGGVFKGQKSDGNNTFVNSY
jgi:hypothetical protein